MGRSGSDCLRTAVALLAEGVDRNKLEIVVAPTLPLVALLAEGVDRNSIRYNEVGGFFTVALLAEGVDRNKEHHAVRDIPNPSPSSRRAWIEISASILHGTHAAGRPPRGGRG